MLLFKSPGLGASGPSCVGLAKLAKLPGKSLWLAQFDLPTHSGERDRQSPSVPTKVSVTTGPRGTLSTAPIIWNLVDWNGSRRKVSFLQILQSLGEGSKPQRRERGMFYRRCDCRTTAQFLSLADITNQPLLVPGSRTQHKSLWCWYGTRGEPLGTHKSDPACRSDLQTLGAAGVTAGASAPPRSAFSASVSAAETCRSHRGLGAAV